MEPPLEGVEFSGFSKYNTQLKILRLDKMHPDFGGNKFFKLKRNIEKIKKLGSPPVLSFGGAYSNHLRALAAAGKMYSFKTLGLVRGEIVRPLNPVLKFCEANGMELHALSRSAYRLKSTEKHLDLLRNKFGEFYLLPEGGSNREALFGCAEIPQFIPQTDEGSLRHIILACGTGLTLSGIAIGSSSLKSTKIIGFSTLKAPGYLAQQITKYLHSFANSFARKNLAPWRVEDNFHCGGYAKTDAGLLEFIKKFNKETMVPLEPVYTGKMLYGFSQLLGSGVIPPGGEVIAIHTGGIHNKMSDNQRV